jgi:hypothetical protein
MTWGGPPTRVVPVSIAAREAEPDVDGNGTDFPFTVSSTHYISVLYGLKEEDTNLAWGYPSTSIHQGGY